MRQPSAEMLAKLGWGTNIITNMFSGSLGRAVRRIVITLALLLWIVILSVPLLALLLATRGQLQWQRGNFSGDRIWLLSNNKQAGVAWEARRLTSQAPDRACVTTRVSFLVWRGLADGLYAEYCDCYDLPAAEPLVATGTCVLP